VSAASSNKSKGLLYGPFAGLYDVLWKRVMKLGWKHSMERIEIPEGARVIEIGVGTGLSLPLYPPECSIVGVDLSGPMLKRARARVKREGLTNVELIQADAQKLDVLFEPRSFDVVVTAFTLSVVPDPAALLRGMCHVAKDDALIVVINHMRSEKRWKQRVEEFFNPICRRVGWDSVADLRPVVDAAGIDVQSSSRFGVFNLWTCLMARKADHLCQPQGATAAAESGSAAAGLDTATPDSF
jgi:phosphatidylethanolamine/phosphatidyl-N-methylethanolamine N-methyltransferase